MTTPASTSPPVRFGMIGAGWMGNAITPDFALCESTELLALGSRDLEAGRAFAADRGIPKAETVDALLADDDIDVVYVATPHHNHHELALAAIEAGKHVLVEKAFTMNAAEAAEVVAAATAQGVFLMEAMWMRFNPSVLRVLELLRDGAIGEPRTLIASFGFAAPDSGGRLWDRSRAGGTLLDQGVYPLSLAQLVFGDPLTVEATGSRLGYGNAPVDVDTELGALLGYEGGQQAVLATSIRSVLPLTASIGGAEGSIELAEAFWSDTTYTVRKPDGTRETVTTPREGAGYVPMLRAVAEAVRAGWTEHPLSPLDATIALMQTVDRVRDRLDAGY
ncbi:Gfo/Idh/MocA family oxidoreductase [soil metagenome]